MFLIRTQQEARLKEGARHAFLSRVEQYVIAVDPERVGKLDAAHLRQFVERNWELARGFGITSERGLCGFMEVACKLGDDFTAKYDWAAEILKSADYEDKKLTRLRGRMADLQQPNGGNGDQGKPNRGWKGVKSRGETEQKEN